MYNKKGYIMNSPFFPPREPKKKQDVIPPLNDDISNYMFIKPPFNWSLDKMSIVPRDMWYTTQTIIPNKLYDVPRPIFFQPLSLNFSKDCITIQCNDMNLQKLPDLPPRLRILDCKNNKIMQLPKLPSTLIFLDCSGNLLTTLPTLPPNLECLIISQNQIKTLPQLPKSLRILRCSNNKLSDPVIFTKFHIENLEAYNNPLPYVISHNYYPEYRKQRAKELITNWIFDTLFKPNGHFARRAVERAKQRMALINLDIK